MDTDGYHTDCVLISLDESPFVFNLWEHDGSKQIHPLGESGRKRQN